MPLDTPLTGAGALLDDIIERLSALPKTDADEIIRLAEKATEKMLWVPNPGPQAVALESEADELFLGGSAGGGKSSFAVGAALANHERSIIFRREYPQIKGLEDEAQKILGSRAGYNAQEKTWRIPGTNKILEFGSCPHESDKEKYQGRPHDYIAFDELPHFAESQYRFLIGWNRSTNQNQRCRVVSTGNPPISAEQMWVIQYWAAWLDPTHPNPAAPGELRWYTTIDGKDVELPNGNPVIVKGRSIRPRSRTFIPARLEDNPDLMRTNYASVLEALPEELRVRLRDGSFAAAIQDGEFQVIPTKWIIEAQARWKPDGFKDFAMTAMAFDPAGGGRDAAELIWRHGTWFSEPVTTKGEETADGSSSAATIIKYRRDNAPIIVDVGGGYGGSVTMRLKDNRIDHIPFNGANRTGEKTKDRQLGFVNYRALAWWRFREALDPDQEGGSPIALPPDPELRADLAAPTYEVGMRGIQIESKEDLRKRLGRSPGKGDVAVMAWSGGQQAIKRNLGGLNPSTRPEFMTIGHANRKTRRRR